MINLGTSGDYVILAKTGVSTTGASSVTGDVGISPAQATYITGFGLILPASGTFSTSALITGKIYAPGYEAPTPANVSTAVGDMQTAYTDGQGRSLGAITELGAGNIGGLTLAPGLYKWGTGVTIPTDVTLSGSANDVWIFQIAQTLDISSAKKIVLSGGAKASNIFWVVAGQTTIGTGAEFNGNILDQTAIVLNTGATLNGRALAQTAVTLDANNVTIPTGSPSNSNSDSNSGSNSNTTTNTNNDNNETVNTTVHTNEEGCSDGDIFNTANGSKCINNEVASQGCSNGNIFNTSTGAICINNTNLYNFGNSNLENGSKGEEVKSLQKFLNKTKGFLSTSVNFELIVDGDFGIKTKEMVKKWQNDNNLSSDGIVGVKTKLKMNKETF